MIQTDENGRLRIMPAGYKPKVDIEIEESDDQETIEGIEFYKGTHNPHKGRGMFATKI